MKIKITIITFSCMAFIGLIGTFWSSTVAEAATGIWNSCQRGMVDCYYPGQCHSYIDTNDDGICDRSQSDSQQNSTSGTSDIIIADMGNPDTGIVGDDAVEIPEVSPDMNGQQSIVNNDIDGLSSSVTGKVGNRSSYYFIPILMGAAILYYFTWLLSRRKVIRQQLHRRIWNIVLLCSTIISALLGLFLILNLDFNLGISLPFNMLFWHVEAGIAMGIIAAFHIMWHWKYFVKIVRTEPGSS